jgi:hypothetical protein
MLESNQIKDGQLDNCLNKGQGSSSGGTKCVNNPVDIHVDDTKIQTSSVLLANSGSSSTKCVGDGDDTHIVDT